MKLLRLSLSLLVLSSAGFSTPLFSTPLIVSAAAAESVEFAIPNAQRPGANAPACSRQDETLDGCTFHVRHDGSVEARLPLGGGERWVATTTNADLLEIRTTAGQNPDATQWQAIELVPTTQADADVVVTFDRLTGAENAQKVIERRRVNVMVHSDATWN